MEISAAMPDEEIRALHPAHDRASVANVLARLRYFEDGSCIVHDIFGAEVRGGLGVTLQVRCRPRAEQGAADGAGDAGETCGCAELVGFRRFPGARLDLRITPTLSEPVPVAVFSELCRAVRCGDCAGPTSLDLSGCYWSWGDDMVGWGGVCRGPMLVLPVYCMERESESRASADAPQCVSAHSPCAG